MSPDPVDIYKTTLIEVAAENVGVLKAGQALAYLVTWCWAMNRRGVEMTAEEYGEEWELSRATAFRHRRLVAEAFVGVDLVQVAKLVEEFGQGRRTQRGALKVAAQVAPLIVEVQAA